MKHPAGWIIVTRRHPGSASVCAAVACGGVICGCRANPLFHRKFMSLLRVGFEYWQPGEVDKKHGVPEKNFDQFREDVTILAGFYFPVVRTDGTVRIKAKSISFASMDEEEFERLYQATLTVLLERVLVGMSDADIERIQNNLLSYA